MAGVVIERLSKFYNSERVIDNLSLAIKDGEFFVFVGPSGSGKSTILRLIAGLSEPDSGDIRFDGTTVTALKARERNVAMVFQNYALYPHKNVYENIAFGLRAKKKPKDEIDRRVKRISSVLGIEKLLKRWPKELSGGERQRVAIGRAMVRDPKLYLLDEPLSNLDARLRIEMRNELARLHRGVQTTFIYVTHDQTEAMTLGNRIAVVNQGKIEQVDTPENLYNFPVNTFVAGFIGSPAMNFIDGRFVYHGKDAGIAVNGVCIELGRAAAHQLSLADNTKIIVGVRPESVKIDLSAGSPLQAEVIRVEPIGHEGFIYLESLGSKLVARVNDWQEIKGVKKLAVAINAEDMYLFLPEDGRCIWGRNTMYSNGKPNINEASV